VISITCFDAPQPARGALRNAAMLIPISRGSMFSSAIVRLFHRRLDPHLDQVQDLPAIGTAPNIPVA
jgi:hypothetical protein